MVECQWAKKLTILSHFWFSNLRNKTAIWSKSVKRRIERLKSWREMSRCANTKSLKLMFRPMLKSACVSGLSLNRPWSRMKLWHNSRTILSTKMMQHRMIKSDCKRHFMLRRISSTWREMIKINFKLQLWTKKRRRISYKRKWSNCRRNQRNMIRSWRNLRLCITNFKRKPIRFQCWIRDLLTHSQRIFSTTRSTRPIRIW